MCLNDYAKQLPSHTAPAGYTCPSCNTGVFPPSNMVSPVAQSLREVLTKVNWARAGLGLPLVSVLTVIHNFVSINWKTNFVKLYFVKWCICFDPKHKTICSPSQSFFSVSLMSVRLARWHVRHDHTQSQLDGYFNFTMCWDCVVATLGCVHGCKGEQLTLRKAVKILFKLLRTIYVSHFV